jgi:hypothetical protein
LKSSFLLKLVNEVSPANAYAPIDVIESQLIVVKEVLFLNASASINWIDVELIV